MKNIARIGCLLALVLLLGQCKTESSRDAGSHDAAAYATAEEYYTCPMHPSVRSDKPGACPVCNMSLVKVSGRQGGADEGFRLTAQHRQLANIKVEVARQAGVTAQAILTGEVTLDESAAEEITARLPGRIDRLYVRSTGEQIRKGQPLYQIYSEELVAAQQQYLLALKQEGINLGGLRQELAESAWQKLLLWGMSEGQIRQLAASGKPQPRHTVHSPVSGTLTGLPATEGGYVQEGTVLFRIANLGLVWVQAQLYPQELALLAGKPTVRVVTEAHPADTLAAELVLNNPSLEQNRQLNLASFKVPNPKGKLRPGMMAYMLVGGRGEKGVVIPQSAIIGGDIPMAWVEAEDNTFQNRALKLGARSKDYVVVTDGIHAGEKVVVSGAYLLNSEYILRIGPAAVHQH